MIDDKKFNNINSQWIFSSFIKLNIVNSKYGRSKNLSDLSARQNLKTESFRMNINFTHLAELNI